jgi:hypothetical protein
MPISAREAAKDFECSERIIVSTPYMSIQRQWFAFGHEVCEHEGRAFS